jgi:pimeloyl-ACP methyl ester carboxylesterase
MNTFALIGLALSASSTAPERAYSFAVTVVGKGKPVILIPGLACTGEVWNGTVAHLRSRYECHVLTLPGFGRQPPIQGRYLSRVRDDILAYVRNKKLDHPALIGHSLGGFMVFALAEAEPNRWGPIIAVDGVPFFGLLHDPSATAQSMQGPAAVVARQLRSATPAQFRAGVHSTLSGDITDPRNVETVFASSKYSDQQNLAEATKELLTKDLRPGLAAIRSRVLLLGAGQRATSYALKKSLTATYRSEISAIPGSRLEMDWRARHFVMLDDPDYFYKTVQAFLSTNR